MSTAPSRVEQGDWRQLGEQASEIRRQVFIEEQAVPQQEEWDGRDDECLHFLARLDGQPVGTARLLPDGHIGRVAVLAAGRGRGMALMQAAIEAARERGHAHAELAAQTHALAFYRRLGFEAYGPEFLDAGIAHRNMRLDLA